MENAHVTWEGFHAEDRTHPVAFLRDPACASHMGWLREAHFTHSVCEMLSVSLAFQIVSSRGLRWWRGSI